MREAFIVSFILNMMLAVVSLFLSPSQVAIHFGVGGVPNGWASASINALILSGVNVFIFVTFLSLPVLMRKMPEQWINLPNKEYWTKEENRKKMEARLNPYSYQFGLATHVFLFMAGALVLQANLSDPVRLREDFFVWPFGLYMAYAIYWCVKIIFVFRLPKENMS